MQQHGLQHGTGDKVPGIQVGVNHLAPLLRLQPDEEVVLADTGIVNQHLDIIFRMGLLPLFQGLSNSLGASHVKLEEFSLALNGLEAIGRRGVVGHVVDEHVIALLMEFFTNGAADTPAAARHECNSHFTIALKVFKALMQVPNTPCRPMFCPVR